MLGAEQKLIQDKQKYSYIIQDYGMLTEENLEEFFKGGCQTAATGSQGMGA